LTWKEVVMGAATSLREVVEPVVTTAGLEVWDVESGPGLVRVLVDGPDGVDLDTLGRVTALISDALDSTDLTPSGRYHLEVSSPGVERALRTPDQYRRFVGSVVSVKTAAPIDGERRFRGLLAGVDESGVTLVGEGDVAGDGRRLDFADIQKAHTVLVWGPAPKPGHRQAAGRRPPGDAGLPAPVKDPAP
jgi:ribosome maturation factor RimP